MRLSPAPAAFLALGAMLLGGCSTVSSVGDSISSFGSSVGSRLGNLASGWIYRPNTPQGNLITKEMIEQVELGMAKNQVQFLLGEPLIKDLFHKERWDYTYYYNPLRGDIQLRNVVIFFDENDRVMRVESPDLPTEQQADELIVGIATDYDPALNRERKVVHEATAATAPEAATTEAPQEAAGPGME